MHLMTLASYFIKHRTPSWTMFQRRLRRHSQRAEYISLNEETEMTEIYNRRRRLEQSSSLYHKIIT